MKNPPPDSGAEAIHEPPSDWVRLDHAPYYCFREGFVMSSEAWKLAVKSELEEIVGSSRFKSTETWSFDLCNGDLPFNWQVRMRSAGISTVIWPGAAYVKPADSDHWSILCSGASMWASPGRAVPQSWDDELARCRTLAEGESAIEHGRVLMMMSYYWRSYFLTVLESGRLRIMARRNSVLAPFEPVTLDQWAFFKLDEPSEKPPANWFDPREVTLFKRQFSDCAATGPAGERIFAICVAPGFGSADSQPLEQKCQLWIRGLVRDSPDRAPKSKALLFDEAADMFPGLAKKTIEHIMLTILAQTGHLDWLRAGRPPGKSPGKSPPNK
jgi:hypothetical protein